MMQTSFTWENFPSQIMDERKIMANLFVPQVFLNVVKRKNALGLLFRFNVFPPFLLLPLYLPLVRKIFIFYLFLHILSSCNLLANSILSFSLSIFGPSWKIIPITLNFRRHQLKNIKNCKKNSSFISTWSIYGRTQHKKQEINSSSPFSTQREKRS